MQEDLPESRVQIVAHEHFGLGDVSVSAQIARIKAAKRSGRAWATNAVRHPVARHPGQRHHGAISIVRHLIYGLPSSSALLRRKSLSGSRAESEDPQAPLRVQSRLRLNAARRQYTEILARVAGSVDDRVRRCANSADHRPSRSQMHRRFTAGPHQHLRLPRDGSQRRQAGACVIDTDKEGSDHRVPAGRLFSSAANG